MKIVLVKLVSANLSLRVVQILGQRRVRLFVQLNVEGKLVR